ncbi:unnamed protein product [Acanthosepion pharaonis]|uniref:Uncharacterized protein n=1 Tax=Acanthosepion pharaonis TaxID=158019 RepID=A0A812B1A4_ACAPH|nr:unnamed protein product [Sepia pharaonis]
MYMSDQRHLMCPSKQGISWPTAVSKTHADKIRNAHINQQSRESHSAEKLPNQQKRSASLPPAQTLTQREPQGHRQEETILPNDTRHRPQEISSFDYHNQPSPKSSYRGTGGSNKSDVNTSQEEDTVEVYTSQYCNPRSKQIGQPTQETEMKPLAETVNYPSDTTIVARGFYTPNITQNTDNKDSVTEDSNSSDISQQSTGNIYRNPRPLPPVPH